MLLIILCHEKTPHADHKQIRDHAQVILQDRLHKIRVSKQLNSYRHSEASPQEVPDVFFPVVSKRKQYLKRAFKNFYSTEPLHIHKILLGSSREIHWYSSSFRKYSLNIH